MSICGWLLHILRSTEGKQFAHIRRTQYTAANSCQDLQKVGLGATMGFMLEILEVTTVDELVEQLGITNNFAAKMLARKQLHHIRKRFIEKEVCNLNNSTLERIVDS